MTIKQIMSDHFKHLKYDKKLINKIETFRLSWLARDKNHQEFISKPYIGYATITFSEGDLNNFFVNVLEVDRRALIRDIAKARDLVHDREVSTNPFYLTIMWLIYSFKYSKLNKEDKDKAIKELYYLYAYRTLTAKHHKFFPEPLSMDVAVATYERLQNYFIIKKTKSWQGYFRYRSRDIREKGIYYDRLKTFKGDEVTKIINALYNRINSTLIKYTAVVYEVIEQGKSIQAASSFGTDPEGNLELIEVDNKAEQMIKNAIDQLSNPNTAIKADILYLYSVFMKNVKIEAVNETLLYISDNYLKNKNTYDKLIEDIITISLTYLHRIEFQGDLKEQMDKFMILLKGYWSNGKVKGRDYLKVKRDITNLVIEATGIKTKWIVSTIVITMILYIFTLGVI